MSKHEADPTYVRASVWPKCNLHCTYCPVDEGMENRVPDRIAGQGLTTEQYIRNLRLIAAGGVRGVSFTGGEPTLRRDLDSIIAGVRPYFDRVELTTNGRRLPAFYDAVREHIDLLKVSLDSLIPERVEALTGHRIAFPDAQRAIDWALDSAVPLAINIVLMRDTLPELTSILERCCDLSKRATAPFHLSLLDFYFSPSRRQEWLDGFVPTSEVADMLSDSYGPPATHERFGCRFYWFDVGNLSVRLKDSYSATMRAGKCQSCTSYCQEGIYGVKHSYEGWLTTCPSSREDLGVHLAADLDGAAASERIAHVLGDVRQARPQGNSFGVMRSVHALPDPVLRRQQAGGQDANWPTPASLLLSR